MDAVVGSAAMPFVFPPRKFDNEGKDLLLIDGGSTWNNCMIPAIHDCMSMEGINGPDQIEVDIMVLSPWNLSHYEGKENDKTIDYFLRMRDVRSYYSDTNDVLKFIRAYPDINFRYFFQP